MNTPFHATFLEEMLRRRKEKNPRYSLRAFASSLKIDPSTLCRLLNGKQEMPTQIAIQILNRLKPSEEEQARFIDSIAREKYRRTLLTLSEGASIDDLFTALRESEERYSTLMDIVDQTVAVGELLRGTEGEAKDAYLLRANPAWEKYIGISAGSACGRLISDLFPKSHSALIEIYERVVNSGHAERVEHYISDIDQWFDVIVAPLEDDRFMVLGVSATERHNRQERETYLLKLSDTLGPLSDARDIQREASRVLGEHLGADRAFYIEVSEDGGDGLIHQGYAKEKAFALCGKFSLSTFPRTWELSGSGPVILEDIPNCPELPPAERASYQMNSVQAQILVTLHKDGKRIAGLALSKATPHQWRPLEVELVKETAERTWAAVMRARLEEQRRIIAEDLQKSEQRLAMIFETLPIAIASIDAQGVVRLSNREMRRYLPTGIVPSRDGSQIDRWKGFHPDGSECAKSDFPSARALRGEDFPEGMNMIFTEDGGKEVKLHVTTRPIKDRQKQVTGAIVIVKEPPAADLT